jgi:hypothetical protein
VDKLRQRMIREAELEAFKNLKLTAGDGNASVQVVVSDGVGGPVVKKDKTKKIKTESKN